MRLRLIAAAAVLIGHLLSAPGQCQNERAKANGHFAFQGKLLVVACDTDMLASAYVDGKLGPAAGPDVLSVIRLDGSPPRLSVASVPVTNSVTGPPAAVAVSPDGHFAIVVETQGPRPTGKPNATMKDLAVGKKITVVDLSDPSRPAVAQVLESYERPVSVAFNPAGSLVLIAYAPRGHVPHRPIALFRFEDGRLTPFSEPAVPGFAPGDELSDAEFLPGSNALGLVYATKGHSRVALLRFSMTKAQAALQPWGEPVAVDGSPFLVKFTKDGHFAVVNSMAVDANSRGTITSIRLATPVAAAGVPTHTIVSHVEAGQYPEGLAMSPNERWVATANLEESFEPQGSPKQEYFASLSLFRFDSQTGRITRVGDFPFDGVLPEPIVFDDSSQFIAAGSFQHYDNPTAGGSIRFWRIADRNNQANRVELIELDESVPLSRGPESMAIVR